MNYPQINKQHTEEQLVGVSRESVAKRDWRSEGDREREGETEVTEQDRSCSQQLFRYLSGLPVEELLLLIELVNLRWQDGSRISSDAATMAQQLACVQDSARELLEEAIENLGFSLHLDAQQPNAHHETQPFKMLGQRGPRGEGIGEEEKALADEDTPVTDAFLYLLQVDGRRELEGVNTDLLCALLARFRAPSWSDAGLLTCERFPEGCPEWQSYPPKTKLECYTTSTERQGERGEEQCVPCTVVKSSVHPSAAGAMRGVITVELPGGSRQDILLPGHIFRRASNAGDADGDDDGDGDGKDASGHLVRVWEWSEETQSVFLGEQLHGRFGADMVA